MEMNGHMRETCLCYVELPIFEIFTIYSAVLPSQKTFGML